MKYYFGKTEMDFSNGTNKSLWRKIDIDNFKIKRPIVICFGGNLTKDDRSANGISKIASTLVGEYSDVDFISCVYSKSAGSDTGYMRKKDIEDVVQKLLLPLATDKTGGRLSEDEARKNTRLVNMFSHCHGARVVIPEIVGCYAKILSQVGYQSEEIENILKDIFVVGYVAGKCKRVSGIMIKSLDDSFFGHEYIRELLAISEGEKEVEITNDSKKLIEDLPTHPSAIQSYICRSSIYGQYVLTKGKDIINVYTASLSLEKEDHSIYTIERPIDWRVWEDTSRQGDIVSQTMAYVLSLAILNSCENKVSDKHIPLNMGYVMHEADDILSQLRPHKNANEIYLNK